MRSSRRAFVSIGRLYCRHATATKLGFARLTATWGNTEANLAVFLLMLVSTTPAVSAGSAGVCAHEATIPIRPALALSNPIQNRRPGIRSSEQTQLIQTADSESRLNVVRMIIQVGRISAMSRALTADERQHAHELLDRARAAMRAIDQFD